MKILLLECQLKVSEEVWSPGHPPVLGRREVSRERTCCPLGQRQRIFKRETEDLLTSRRETEDLLTLGKRHKTCCFLGQRQRTCCSAGPAAG